MNKTIQAIVGGIFGVAMLALIVSPNGATAIKQFFGGLGYATGVAEAPSVGSFPTYPKLQGDLGLHGIQSPRVRPHTPPNVLVTVPHWGKMVPSRSYEVWGVQGELPGSQPTHFTPWGLFVALARPLRRLRDLGPPTPTMSPGAYVTDPALFQLIGIPEPFPMLQVKPAAGRTSTPPARHFAINPFPSARLPLPTYPAPASFKGSF